MVNINHQNMVIFILNLHANFEYGASIQLKCLLFVNMYIKPRHMCSLQGGMENLGKHVKGPSHDGICSGNTAGW